MKKAIVLYMPALHRGYIDLISNDGRPDSIFLISEKILKEEDEDLAWLFEKDLRAVSSKEMQKALTALGLSDSVDILNETNLRGYENVIIPDDDEIVEKVLSRFYPQIVPIKKKWFIRWGRKTVLSQREPVPEAVISENEFDKKIMEKIFQIAEKSSDWWRQVAVMIFPIKGDPIIGFNHHLPHAQAPYINGDPRTNFKPGEHIELSTAGHAERSALGYATKKGIALQDASMFVTTFPCPACAYAIIDSGIKLLYYCEGYSQMGAAETLKAAGVSIIFVNVPK